MREMQWYGLYSNKKIGIIKNAEENKNHNKIRKNKRRHIA